VPGLVYIMPMSHGTNHQLVSGLLLIRTQDCIKRLNCRSELPLVLQVSDHKGRRTPAAYIITAMRAAIEAEGIPWSSRAANRLVSSLAMAGSAAWQGHSGRPTNDGFRALSQL
jgi:hypothetical protein